MINTIQKREDLNQVNGIDDLQEKAITETNNTKEIIEDLKKTEDKISEYNNSNEILESKSEFIEKLSNTEKGKEFLMRLEKWKKSPKNPRKNIEGQKILYIEGVETPIIINKGCSEEKIKEMFIKLPSEFKNEINFLIDKIEFFGGSSGDAPTEEGFIINVGENIGIGGLIHELTHIKHDIISLTNEKFEKNLKKINSNGKKEINLSKLNINSGKISAFDEIRADEITKEPIKIVDKDNELNFEEVYILNNGKKITRKYVNYMIVDTYFGDNISEKNNTIEEIRNYINTAKQPKNGFIVPYSTAKEPNINVKFHDELGYSEGVNIGHIEEITTIVQKYYDDRNDFISIILGNKEGKQIPLNEEYDNLSQYPLIRQKLRLMIEHGFFLKGEFDQYFENPKEKILLLLGKFKDETISDNEINEMFNILENMPSNEKEDQITRIKEIYREKIKNKNLDLSKIITEEKSSANLKQIFNECGYSFDDIKEEVEHIEKENFITINFDPRIIGNILEKGYKSGLEGDGFPYQMGNRLIIERKYGISYLKTVYGALCTNKNEKIRGGTVLGQDESNIQFTNYGNCFLKLKDSVKKRCTCTFGDTFGVKKDNNIVSDDIHEFGLLSYGDGIKAKALLNKMQKDKNPKTNRIPYIDTQIHGGIAIQDIESINYAPIHGGSKNINFNELSKIYNTCIEKNISLNINIPQIALDKEIITNKHIENLKKEYPKANIDLI